MYIYGIKNCDKVRAAVKWAREQSLDYQLHDYRLSGLDITLVNMLTEHFTLQQLINKRSTTWREITQHEKDDISAQLLIDYPTLIKRPIVNLRGKWTIGLDTEQWLRLIGQ